MSDKSGIEWTDATWNPIRGCSRVSEGCRNCYAERVAARFGGPYKPYSGVVRWRNSPDGTTRVAGWNGKVEFVEVALTLPLRWKQPRRIFVNSMSDLFHEQVPDEWIDRVFAVMALTQRHTYQVLTKRPERMLAWFSEWRKPDGGSEPRWCAVSDAEARDHGRRNPRGWPLPNVWLGVSAENKPTLDRLDYLRETPAAVRFVSFEPLLEDLGDLGAWLLPQGEHLGCIDWVIVGGESGSAARPCDLAWIRSVIAQCKAASVPVFIKQAGARPFLDGAPLRLKDRKGGDLSELPADLRVREFPR